MVSHDRSHPEGTRLKKNKKTSIYITKMKISRDVEGVIQRLVKNEMNRERKTREKRKWPNS